MANSSTRLKLLSLIEDVEIVSKELIEHIAAPKNLRSDDIDTTQLVELLIIKDKEIQSTMEVAKQQIELQKIVNNLTTAVESRDQDIKQLQKNLKEAETLLATAVYQAKQKLEYIHQANAKRISSEELIKYAHKISASNSVAAPTSWAPGDIRRPYPADYEMRRGILANFDRLASGQGIQVASGVPGSYHDTIGMQGAAHIERAAGHQSVMSWQQESPSLEVPSFPTGIGVGLQQSGAAGGSNIFPGSFGGLTPRSSQNTSSGNVGVMNRSVSIETAKGHNKENEDVELMSSDSSSSTSSDE